MALSNLKVLTTWILTNKDKLLIYKGGVKQRLLIGGAKVVIRWYSWGWESD